MVKNISLRGAAARPSVGKNRMTATSSQLEILRTRSVPDLVRQEILDLIKTGELVAGDKLNRAHLRQAFRGQPGADP